jgi:hypothetical protein
MNKVTSTLIGFAIAVVIFAIAFRIYDGSSGKAKVGDVELSVGSKLEKSTMQPKQIQETTRTQGKPSTPVCDGEVTTLLSNNVAEVKRWMKTKDNLKVSVVALSPTEADLSISDNDNNEIKTLTIRAGRTVDFLYLKHKYQLKLNSIYEVRKDLRVNVTMYKTKCS